MSQDYNIRVVCRLRPLNKIEIGHGGECCVNFSDKSIEIAVTLIINKVGGDENKYEFGFDKIFAPDTQQVTVYDEVAKPILNGKGLV
jgi:kinesin family protein 5